MNKRLKPLSEVLRIIENTDYCNQSVVKSMYKYFGKEVNAKRDSMYSCKYDHYTIEEDCGMYDYCAKWFEEEVDNIIDVDELVEGVLDL